MRYIIIILFLLFYFQDGYSQLEFYECPKEKKQQYVTSSMLTLRYKMNGDTGQYINWRIDTGNMYVFKQEQVFECGTNGHSRVIASLYFTIPMGKQSFDLTVHAADSLKGNIVYFTGCGCLNYLYEMKSAEGIIKGALINGVWELKGSVRMQLYEHQKKFSIEKDVVIDGYYKPWKQTRKEKRGSKYNGF